MIVSDRSSDAPTVVFDSPVASRYVFSLHPLWLIGFAWTLNTLPALFSTHGQRLAWHQGWIMSGGDFVLQSLGYAALAVGTVILRWRGPAMAISIGDQQLRRLDLLAKTLFWTAGLGYLVWFLSAFAHGFGPGLFVDLLTAKPGAAGHARDTFVTVPGVSTLTEVAPVAEACLVLLYRLGRRHPVYLWTLLVLGAVRLVSNSERLGLLEVVLPALVVIALVPRRGPVEPPRTIAGRTLARVRGRLEPVLAPVRRLRTRLHSPRPRPSVVYFLVWAASGCLAFGLAIARLSKLAV